MMVAFGRRFYCNVVQESMKQAPTKVVPKARPGRSPEEVAARLATRRKNLALATLGVVAGHGLTLYAYFNFDAVQVGDFQLNLAPAGGFLGYMALTWPNGGIIFYVLGQLLMTGVSFAGAILMLRNWIQERAPHLGTEDTPDLYKLLGDLRLSTPPPAKMEVTSGHITQMGTFDEAVIAGTRAIYALFSSKDGKGMTKDKLQRFLKGEAPLDGEMVLPTGKVFAREQLSEHQFKMLDTIYRTVDSEEDGTISYRAFSFASIISWAARDGNPQAQQVVMFRLMDKEGTGSITAEAMEPWVKKLLKNGSIPQDHLTVRSWHLLAFRDVAAHDLARRYFKEADVKKNGAIDLGDFARMSAQFECSKVYEEMVTQNLADFRG